MITRSRPTPLGHWRQRSKFVLVRWSETSNFRVGPATFSCSWSGGPATFGDANSCRLSSNMNKFISRYSSPCPPCSFHGGEPNASLSRDVIGPDPVAYVRRVLLAEKPEVSCTVWFHRPAQGKAFYYWPRNRKSCCMVPSTGARQRATSTASAMTPEVSVFTLASRQTTWRNI